MDIDLSSKIDMRDPIDSNARTLEENPIPANGLIYSMDYPIEPRDTGTSIHDVNDMAFFLPSHIPNPSNQRLFCLPDAQYRGERQQYHDPNASRSTDVRRN